jgi:hypothetical protein
VVLILQFQNTTQVLIAVSVYVALTVDASSSRASTEDALHDDQESYAGDMSCRQSHSHVTLLKTPQRQKPVLTSAPWRKSKGTKVDVGSKREIMFPLFVEEGLVDPSERVNRKNARCFISVL